MQVRVSGFRVRTASSGISRVIRTSGTDQVPRCSRRGSQTVTAKSLNSAMVARYSASAPAPMSSIRYCGPRVLVSLAASNRSASGAGAGVRVTAPVMQSTVRCTSCPDSSRCTSVSSAARSGWNSSSSSKVPPQGRPKRCASSAVTP